MSTATKHIKKRFGVGEHRPDPKNRGYRALRATCEAFGIDEQDVGTLRRERAHLFHEAWTAEMVRLARAEKAWKPEWDGRPSPSTENDEDENEATLDPTGTE